MQSKKDRRKPTRRKPDAAVVKMDTANDLALLKAGNDEGRMMKDECWSSDYRETAFASVH
jgi:hypothetical protein